MGKSATLKRVINKLNKIGYAIVNLIGVFNIVGGKSGFNNAGSRVHNVGNKHVLTVGYKGF